MKNERSRNFSLITYHSEEVLKTVLSGVSQIRHYAYIYHDKDKKEDPDELKEPHFHVLLNTQYGMTESAVKKLFPRDQSTLTQITRDKSDSFLYLTHKNNPEKYQYADDAVVCDDVSFWQSCADGADENEKSMSILYDILACVPFREMCIRYGRDFIIHCSQYLAMAEKIRYEEKGSEPFPDRTVCFADAVNMSIFDGASGELLVSKRRGK